MRNFVRYLSADVIKIKRSPALWMHFLIPVIGTFLFLIIYAFQRDKVGDAITSFLGSMMAAFPVLIGIVTGLSAEQEAEAGNSQELLFHPSRLQALFSKIVLFFLLGGMSMLLAVFGFALSFSAAFHVTFFSTLTYLKIILTMLLCNLITYLIHWFFGMRFGRNISIGVGIVEAVLGMLLLTVLGDAIWPLVPCAWSFRLLRAFLTCGNLSVNFGGKMLAMVTIPVLTIFTLLLLILWFLHWEGNKAEE